LTNVSSSKPTQSPRKKFSPKALFPLVLLAIGLLLITLQFFSNIGSYVASMFVQVEHPIAYRFLAYDRLLHSCVRGKLVDYTQVRNSQLLQSAMDELAHVSPDRLADPDQQFAFWINAYNLLVIKNVSDHYPINTVRKIDQTFNLRKYLIGGAPYSAEEIRTGKLMPMFYQRDSRGLLLVCGGSMGDPPLQDHAIDAEHMETELRVACYKFVNDPVNVYYDPDTEVMTISRYFMWNKEPIERQFESPFFFANLYLDDAKKIQVEKATHEYFKRFNWYLNDVALADLQRRAEDGEFDDPLQSGGEQP
jgi:hypothetical protein